MMAYYSKNNIERLAECILALTFSEMYDFATEIQPAINDCVAVTNTPAGQEVITDRTDFALALSGWAEGIADAVKEKEAAAK